MWFRNVRIYRLTEALPCPPEELPERLASGSFKPCAGLDTVRSGWVPPLIAAPDGPLLHSHGDYHLLCARTQQRVLPPAAIREVLDEKILALEQERGRRLGRRERADLKDEVVQTLLPRALTRSHLTRALLLPRRALLLVDSAAAARAEDLLNLLRESLGTLAVRPFVPARSPNELMTGWLNGAPLPKRWRLGQYCDLRDAQHQANVVRCRQQELATQEVRHHLEAGKQATGLGLGWDERMSFVLGDDLGIRGLRFGDVVERDAGHEAEVDEAARLDGDFVLMAMELERLAADLEQVFGYAEAA